MFSKEVTGKLKSYGVAIEYKMHGKQREMLIFNEKLRKDMHRKKRRKQREME